LEWILSVLPMAASELETRVIGRGADCDVQIAAESISLRHCQLTRKSDGWWITDEQSTNGTFVNGQRVSKALLSRGDRVRLGLVAFTFDGRELAPSTVEEVDRPLQGTDQQPSVTQRHRMWVSLSLTAAVVFTLIGAVVYLVSASSDGSTSVAATDPSMPVNEDEAATLFEAPPDLGNQVQTARNLVVSVRCGPSEGSGWPIEIGGQTYISTNEHVVRGCVENGTGVDILADGATTDGLVASASQREDLALINVDLPSEAFPTGEPPPIGAWLMVVGNPIGMDRSVTFGTLTNIVDDFLITDAAINPGNSGGPVLNSQGEVVGVASAKLVEEGIDRIGLVIPLADYCVEIIECSSNQWER